MFQDPARADLQYRMTEENLKSTIFIASLFYALGLVCQLGFNFLIFRQFSLEEVGTYGLIVSLAAFAGFAMDLGISQTLIRGFSQNTLSFSQAVIGSLALRIPILVLGSGALALWLHFKSALGAMETSLLALALFTQFFIGFRAIASSWLRAHERQNVANGVDFLAPLGYLGIGLLLVYFHKANLPLFFMGILLLEGTITGLAFATTHKIQLPWRSKEPLNLARIKSGVALLWKPSLILGIVGFWNVLEHRLDWLLVYAYASGRELAFYSLANKVYEVFETGICIIIQILFPLMCKTNLTGDKNPRTIIAFKFIATLGIVLVVVVVLYLPDFLELFWGAKFEKSNNLILWLMCGACLEPVNSIMYYSLISKGNERYLLVTSTIPALTQLVVNIVLIPRYGSLGAVAGMIAMLVTAFLLLSIFSVKSDIFKIDLLVKIFILSCITTVLLVCWFYFNLIFLNTHFFIIALVLIISSFLLSKAEWSLIRSDLKTAIRSLIKWKAA
jgi:O-antigen/teichoic acid export membrane protein